MNRINVKRSRTMVELQRPLHNAALMCVVVGTTAMALLVAAAWPASTAEEASADPPPEALPFDFDIPEPVPDPGDGELEIVESGYTHMTDLVGDAMVSWAAIVTNTSSTMTAVSTVFIEPYDTDGDSLTQERDWGVSAHIHNLMPGETVGVGTTSYIDEGDFADLDLHIGHTDWYKPEESRFGEGNLTTSDIETERVNIGETANYWSSDGISFPENEDGDLLVTFTVESTFPTILENVSATAVFRNDDGDIIGASSPDDIGYHVDYPPGWSIRTVETTYGPPPGIAEEQTEMYAHPS